MSESTAMVPIPFYAPVRVDTGLSYQFGERSNGVLLAEQAVRTIAPEPDDGMTYCRDGGFAGDTRIGRIINLYV
jgi:hypothetical protein